MDKLLYILYSRIRVSDDTRWYDTIRLYGIFTESEIKKFRKHGCVCMIVSLNKFVESGLEL